MTIENKVYEMNEGTYVASSTEITNYMRAQAPVVSAARKEIEIEKLNHSEIEKNTDSGAELPPTFAQNLQSRLNEPHGGYLVSRTMIVYEGGFGAKFKLIEDVKKLRGISIFEVESGGLHYHCVDYDAIKAPEFDKRDGLYSDELTPRQVINHPGWIAAAGSNIELLKQCTNQFFKNSGLETTMAFFLLNESYIPKGTITRMSLSYPHNPSIRCDKNFHEIVHFLKENQTK